MPSPTPRLRLPAASALAVAIACAPSGSSRAVRPVSQAGPAASPPPASSLPPTSSPPPTGTPALALLSSGSTLVVGAGSRIESIDPGTGDVIGSIAPVSLPNLTWVKLLRRGRFLLAEARSDTVPGPLRYYLRGLALFDEGGHLLWAKTHPMMDTNRVGPAVFLGEDGRVAFDSLEKPGLIAPDGTTLDTGYVPAGPVIRGQRDWLPLRIWCSDDVTTWLRLDTRQLSDTPPDDVARDLPVNAFVDEGGKLAFASTVDPYPEAEMWRRRVKTVARVDLPPACRVGRSDVFSTMSPRYEVLLCSPPLEEDHPGRSRRSTLFVVDLRTRELRPIQPPPSDQSGLTPDVRMPDDVSATVRVDGSVIASVWNFCDASVYSWTSAKGWQKSGLVPLFGPPVVPEPVCDSLTMQPTMIPFQGGCGHAAGSSPLDPSEVTYVERQDGTWSTLPYSVGGDARRGCSADRGMLAFVYRDSLVVARLDRDYRKVIRSGARSIPFAWLP